MRGIRGAITIGEDTKEEIFSAVQQLLREICERNELQPECIGAAIFSATEDITAAFPAAGARQLEGFSFVPLFDARQMAVADALPLCIRVLLLVDTERSQTEIQHVYLRGAGCLRPDIARETASHNENNRR